MKSPKALLALGAIATTLALPVASPASSDSLPFAPPPQAKAKILRLLAYPDFFDPASLAAFERASGYQIAYDAYETPSALADKWREGPYDVVLLPGPQLQRKVLEGALARLDRARLTQLKAIQPAVSAKVAAYDPGNLYAIPYGWAPFGLVYDADKAGSRLNGGPTSWTNLLNPRDLSRVGDCGAALPNARDSLFVAAWRLANVDPSRASLVEVKNAGALLLRAKSAARAFAPPDLVGALARGSICLGAGSPGEAEAATERARASGARLQIRFAYPREGGPAEFDSLAIPRDAPNPDEAYALVDFFLRPENAKANSTSARVFSAEDASPIDALKKIWPDGLLDERTRAAVEAEWTKLIAAK